MKLWSRDKVRVAQQRAKAEEALIISQVGYMAAIQMDREAEKIQRGHQQLQSENHFSEKMLGRIW